MIRRTLGAMFAAAMLMSLSIGVASASATTVTQTIVMQDRIVDSSSAAKAIGKKITTPAEAKKAIPEYRYVARALDRAAATVAKASATASQKTGQRDWVSGIRLEAEGINDIATEFEDFVKGDAAGVKAELKRAQALQKSADGNESKGDRLLGLPSSD